jgi:ABC-type nitrate/sulfonate/bicarbonate transport system permease component
MVIAMITLGFIGYFISACVRTLGNQLMAWHVKELAQQGR